MTTSYVYDADNRLTSLTTSGQTTTFTYDANGSLLERASPGETLAYAWDTAGRLTEVARNGTNQATFAVACPDEGGNGDGNRRGKTSGSSTTTYVNDARGLAQVLRATTSTNTVTYVPGIAQYDSSKPTEATKWGYTLSEAQNARLLVDGAGNLGHRWEWEPFGRDRADQGTTTTAFDHDDRPKVRTQASMVELISGRRHKVSAAAMRRSSPDKRAAACTLCPLVT